MSSTSPLSFDHSKFTELEVHRGRYADDFFTAAPELRAELLAHSDWSIMSTNAGVDFARQNGITTGTLDPTASALESCVAFQRQMEASSESLFKLVGDDLGSDAGGEPSLMMNGMAYGTGAWLLPHTDAPPRNLRRLSWILYLTKPEHGEWSDDDGGQLRLSHPDGAEAAVRPKFNRLALFKNSKDSWHEISSVRRRTSWSDCRLALSGWLVAPA